MARIGTQGTASKYKDKYGLRSFVETGIFNGDSVEDAVAMGFHDIYSCDINPAYIVAARQRWPDRVFMIGESQDCLKKICVLNTMPTLFWLDAHLPLYHEADEPREFARFPMYEELKVLLEHKVDLQYDVIMCDDINTIRKNNPNYWSDRVPLDQTIDFIDYDDLFHILSATHKCHVEDVEFGQMIFTPHD